MGDLCCGVNMTTSRVMVTTGSVCGCPWVVVAIYPIYLLSDHSLITHSASTVCLSGKGWRKPPEARGCCPGFMILPQMCNHLLGRVCCY